MHEELVNRQRGLSLPRKSVVRLTDRSDLILDVYRGRETTTQQQRLGPEIIKIMLNSDKPRMLFSNDCWLFNIYGQGK